MNESRILTLAVLIGMSLLGKVIAGTLDEDVKKLINDKVELSIRQIHSNRSPVMTLPDVQCEQDQLKAIGSELVSADFSRNSFKADPSPSILKFQFSSNGVFASSNSCLVMAERGNITQVSPQCGEKAKVGQPLDAYAASFGMGLELSKACCANKECQDQLVQARREAVVRIRNEFQLQIPKFQAAQAAEKRRNSGLNPDRPRGPAGSSGAAPIN